MTEITDPNNFVSSGWMTPDQRMCFNPFGEQAMPDRIAELDCMAVQTVVYVVVYFRDQIRAVT